MSAEPLGHYRLRATMRPMSGAPVNWNARAIIWSGADRRWHLRYAIFRLAHLLRAGHSKATQRRYRLALWLLRAVDDRDRTYTPAMIRIRGLLNTRRDVEARRAWAETGRYWRERERRRAATPPSTGAESRDDR